MTTATTSIRSTSLGGWKLPERSTTPIMPTATNSLIDRVEVEPWINVYGHATAIAAATLNARSQTMKPRSRNSYARSYVHYPILATIINFATLASLALFIAGFFMREDLVNPLLLLLFIPGFGGLSIVLWSAAREIDESAAR